MNTILPAIVFAASGLLIALLMSHNPSPKILGIGSMIMGFEAIWLGSACTDPILKILIGVVGAIVLIVFGIVVLMRW